MTAHTKVSRIMALALAGSLLSGPMLAGTVLAATKKPAQTSAAPAAMGLTRDDARKHAIEIFDRLDFNHDGVVNAEDGKARRDAWLGKMFDRMDTNHDGQISKAEFLAAHDGPGGPGGMRHGGEDEPDHGPADHRGPGHDGPPHDRADRMIFSPRVFAILRQADPQHTGTVTRDAFIAAELKRFDETDANHDGIVTHEEMRAARHKDHHGWQGDERGPQRGGWRHGGPQSDMPPPPPPPPAADSAK
ncbi:MAG: EF-hand domain-containing protein [Sphingomonadales bacterium]|nr:EF-hand domain-containing protein [Sphingomonadales bacterium]MDE2168737.1 EF-hand domain-containing protein [Sphingomonadales bacterium]